MFHSGPCLLPASHGLILGFFPWPSMYAAVLWESRMADVGTFPSFEMAHENATYGKQMAWWPAGVTVVVFQD